MQVENTYLNELLNKLITIDQTYYGLQTEKEGDIGERFVKDSIKYYFWEKGFKLHNSGNRIFDIEEQIGSDKKRGKRGIDFRFSFAYGKIQHDCYVESKNWKKRKITNKMFKTEILDRFTNYANQPNVIWIVTMNKANKSEITQNCKNNNIHILPIDTKIVTSQLNTKSFNPIMEHFLDEIHKLMNVITGVYFNKHNVAKRVNNPKPYDTDIILGMDISFIAKKHGTTPSMVEKRKSELKNKEGVSIIDGRSKTYDLARFVRMDDL
mgnify:CR=1 FL=1